ncbi:MAG: hypothetical protein Q4E15_05055 [Lactobacillus johnsonii]|nr:hypothetical protein [Lactobacillus johnsonii]
MILNEDVQVRKETGVLHVSGDDPEVIGLRQGENKYSPRMWR